MELADMHDSKSCDRKVMGVQLSPAAPLRKSQRVLVMCTHYRYDLTARLFFVILK